MIIGSVMCFRCEDRISYCDPLDFKLCDRRPPAHAISSMCLILNRKKDAKCSDCLFGIDTRRDGMLRGRRPAAERREGGRRGPAGARCGFPCRGAAPARKHVRARVFCARRLLRGSWPAPAPPPPSPDSRPERVAAGASFSSRARRTSRNSLFFVATKRCVFGGAHWCPSPAAATISTRPKCRLAGPSQNRPAPLPGRAIQCR
jgi:hypothetical protein